MKIFLSAITIVALFVALAGPAAAQQAGYSGAGGQVQTQVQDTGSAAAADESGSGSLPFTGLDVALLAGAGLLLAGAGIAMRRVTRAPNQA